jgi:hypothetical protein
MTPTNDPITLAFGIGCIVGGGIVLGLLIYAHRRYDR